MKIAILDDFQDAVRTLACFQTLTNFDVKIYNNSARGIGQLAIRLAEFDALVLIRERTPITRPLLARLPKLKLIAQTGKVSGHIDVAAATERGVVITEGASASVSTAELTWALILASTRKIVSYANSLKEGQWQSASVNPLLNGIGSSLRGRTLGIWGYGRVGQLVAGYGRAFGMRVLVWGSQASRDRAAADGYATAATRAQLFEEADVLSLHVRLADTTRGLVTAQDFARMKPSALFVNTSRAELVAEHALEEALHRGRPCSAALDVFTSEPLAADAPLLRIPTVLATPHLGYVEKDNYELMFGAAFQRIVDFAAGTPSGVLNPEALQPR